MYSVPLFTFTTFYLFAFGWWYAARISKQTIEPVWLAVFWGVLATLIGIGGYILAVLGLTALAVALAGVPFLAFGITGGFMIAFQMEKERRFERRARDEEKGDTGPLGGSP